jgi:hypothetical protein
METKMEAILTTMEAIRDKTIANHKAIMDKLDTQQERPMAHPGETDIDPDPRMMPSTKEHHEIPNREAAVTPVRGLKKQRKVRNLATEHRRRSTKGPGKLVDRGSLPSPAKE